MKYLLDTHTWNWCILSPHKLSSRVINLIEQKKDDDELLLSAVSLWEFSKLVEKKRITISCDGLQWIQKALQDLPLRLVPLNPEIAWHSTVLPGEFHKDPADQIIVATARLENATIITKDELIQNYQYVRTIW